MRSLFFALLIASLLFPFGTFASTASPVVPGDLIKASSRTVYYLGTGQKRYVFPTAGTFSTWYTDFSGVKTISDDEISTYGLAGNITYRPGVKLVKIMSVPRVYAVTRGGVLRWIQTATIAEALYGANWNKQVEDIPDTFFSDYKIGNPISDASQFNPAQETQSVATIQFDKTPIVVTPIAPPVQPAPTVPATTTTPVVTSTTPVSHNSGTLSILGVAPFHEGDELVFFATASPSAVQSIDIFLNDVHELTCTESPCIARRIIPTTLATSTYAVRAVFSWVGDGSFEATSSYVALPNPANNLLSVSLSRTNLRPGDAREIVASANNNFGARRIDLYVDGTNVKTCTFTQECRLNDYETGTIGTSHVVYARAIDGNSTTIQSPSQTLFVVANPVPTLSFAFSNLAPLRSTQLSVTATANDMDGVQNTQIWHDGVKIKECNTISCQATVGPWTEAHSLQFVAQAQDTLGAIGFATSTVINVP